jgi:hypothetical protein
MPTAIGSSALRRLRADKTQVVARTTTGRTLGQRLVAVSLDVSNLKCATSILVYVLS